MVVFLCFAMFGVTLGWAADTNRASSAVNSSNEQSLIGGTQALVIEGGETPRNYPAAGVANYPGLPSYWGIITPDGRFWRVSDFIQFKATWDRFDARALYENGKGKVEVRIKNFRFPPLKENERVPFLIAGVTKPADQLSITEFKRNYQLIGLAEGYGSNGASSDEVFGRIIERALEEVGADLILLNEGAALQLEASGWGIGISNSISTTSSATGAGLGNVATGGTGYSSGKATYVTKPWLQAQLFRKLPGATGNYQSVLPTGISSESPYPEGSPERLDTLKNGKKEKTLDPSKVQKVQ